MKADKRSRTELFTAALLAAVLALATAAVIGRPPGSDATALVLPYLGVQARAAALGQPFPTWDDTVFGGVPLIADPRHQLFYPLAWLALVMNPLRAMAAGVAIHLVVAAFGARALARSSGTSRAGANLAALVYVLAQVTFFDVLVEGFVDYAPGMAWSPWVLHFALRAIRSGAARAHAWGAVCLALFVLGTHANAVLVGLPLLALALACSALLRRSAARRGHAVRAFVFIGTAGILLAAPRWLPIVAYLGESTRASVADAVVTFNEDMSGFQIGARFLGGTWAGLVPLVLALIALAPGRGAQRRWVPMGGLHLAALGAVLVTVGPRTWLGRAVFGLPFVRQVNAQGLCLWFVALAVGIAAGRGHDRMRRLTRAAGLSEIVLALGVGSCLAVAMLVLRGELPFYATDLRPRIAFFEGIPSATDPAMLDSHGPAGDVRAVANLIVPMRRLLAAGSVCAMWLALTLGSAARVRWRSTIVAAVPIAALVADLAMSHYDFVRRYWERAEPPRAPTLPHDGHRIAALGVTGADAASAVSGVGARLHGFRGVLGNGLWMSTGFADLLEARQGVPLGSPRLEPRTLLLASLDSTLARMLDVAWLARADGAGGSTLEPASAAPLGSAWIVPRATLVASRADARAAVARADFDPAAEVVIEAEDAAAAALAPSAAATGAGATEDHGRGESLALERPSASRLLVHLEPTGAPRGQRWLVVSESYASGWCAWVDGQTVPVLRGDLALRAVPIPPVARTVELRFRPRSLRAGLGCAAIGAVAVAWTLLGRRRPR